MPQPQEYVTNQAHYAEQAQDMSGVRGSAQGMAPYPLYGIPALGQEEGAVPFWKKPWFCWFGGAALGVGIGYAVFGYLKPRMKPNRKKKTEES